MTRLSERPFPLAFVELAANAGEKVRFRRGEVIFAEGAPDDGLYIIESGKVKVGRSCADGREHLHAICGPADLLGELAAFAPGPRTSTATALTEVQAVCIDHACLRRWILTRPELADHLLCSFAMQVRCATSKLADQIFSDVPGRLAKTLLQLAQQFGVTEGACLRVDHDLTQEELAQFIGASRETVNKTLAEFTQRGWLQVQHKSVLILDAHRLARRAHRS
ncbi:Crp/Fnr family transcriptional regulator [Lentzea jiangxiensis]|uniref:cAMP-binding domain of CRP or a regulatory subunit of cAMP-dependent protein kinases n=1 Tax=Lentzea jiangxiensis TaxID=641025 RepID=A0A1H0X6C6_9PSEU|nr:Crp/Fnr family transcriptional regulator [Lentzea jiangxiensis]SDP98501.1 cAMP-binding domain of CRP or a regulatory subunit of cAMP-dependent protein kinases [Lentzea jiangxiensis]